MIALVLAICLSNAPQAAEPSPHELSVYFRTGASLYLSQSRTAGGLGGGVGVRDTLYDRYLLQADVQYLSLAGNVLELRAGAGIQRRGTWQPAAMFVLSGLFGNRLAFLNDTHREPVVLPPISLGLHVLPLRFQSGRTTVTVLELGIGLGSDFPGLGVSYRVGLLEVGATF